MKITKAGCYVQNEVKPLTECEKHDKLNSLYMYKLEFDEVEYDFK